MPKSLRSPGHQALIAVLKNSIDASPDESRIAVTASYGNSELLTVSVHDEGEGMGETVRQRAFEPFFSKDGGAKSSNELRVF